jgi:predicted nuclease of predicted toxin-antitoxin system
VKFKLDENLAARCAELLRRDGFSADTVREEGLAGISDLDLFALCQREDRVLLTQDLDFADIRAFPTGSHMGIIVFRSASQDTPTIVAQLKQLISVLKDRSPENQLWIVEPGRIRFRER